MENQIFVVADKKTQYFFIYESNAKEKSEALNKKIQSQTLSEDVFKNMVNDKIFIDTEQYLFNQQSKEVLIDVIEEEQEIKSHNTNNEDIKELFKQVQFLQNKLNVFKDERTELINNVEVLKAENLKLKTKKVVSLEEAVKMANEKKGLEANRNIFLNALDNTNTVLKELENIIDYEDNKSYRLTLNVLDHQEQEAGTLFGISNNLIIKEVIKHINLKVTEKINVINLQVTEIENKFN